MIADWLLRALGAVAIAVSLRDIFHTLWHPSGLGTISHRVAIAIWRVDHVAARFKARSGIVGPVIVFVTVLVWSTLAVAGWAMIYLSWMPEGFHFSGSLEPDGSPEAAASLYFSLVTVATLGFGDIVPVNPALRVLVPVEAVVGFVLLTAGISWVLQIYPALGRRRAVALKLHALATSGANEIVATGDPRIAAALLESLATDLQGVTVDFIQYAETYYFRDIDPETSLAVNLPYALALTNCAKIARSEDVRRLARVLETSIAVLTRHLDEHFLHIGSDPTGVVAGYARDHRQHASP